jgi:hypothetical protein
MLSISDMEIMSENCRRSFYPGFQYLLISFTLLAVGMMQILQLRVMSIVSGLSTISQTAD